MENRPVVKRLEHALFTFGSQDFENLIITDFETRPEPQIQSQLSLAVSDCSKTKLSVPLAKKSRVELLHALRSIL